MLEGSRGSEAVAGIDARTADQWQPGGGACLTVPGFDTRVWYSFQYIPNARDLVGPCQKLYISEHGLPACGFTVDCFGKNMLSSLTEYFYFSYFRFFECGKQR